MHISRHGLLVLIGPVLSLGLTAWAKDQEFRFEKPDAQSVALMCECNGWKGQPMTRQSDGTWTTTVSLAPGSYGYKFLVNGTDWMFDPKNPNRKTVDGIENSVIEITDAGSGSVTSTPRATTTLSPTQISAPATPATNNTTTLAPTPGEILTVEVPLSAKRRAEAAKDGNTRLTHAKMAVAVPQNFDPQKSWPMLVISNTEAYSNIDSLRQFKDAAIAEGWVIMAADGVETEKNKEGGDRWPTIAAAFDYITPLWPAVKDWPVACGGNVGRCKKFRVFGCRARARTSPHYRHAHDGL